MQFLLTNQQDKTRSGFSNRKSKKNVPDSREQTVQQQIEAPEVDSNDGSRGGVTTNVSKVIN